MLTLAVRAIKSSNPVTWNEVVFFFLILHHGKRRARTNTYYLIKTMSTGTYRKWTDEMETEPRVKSIKVSEICPIYMIPQTSHGQDD